MKNFDNVLPAIAIVRKNTFFYMFVFPLVISATLINTVNVNAEPAVPIEYRVNHSFGTQEPVNQYALAFQLRPLHKLRARRLELAIGTFATQSENLSFVSFGGVWKIPNRWLPFNSNRFDVEFGFSPTYISDSMMNGRNLGGHYYFTSSLSVGRFLDRYKTIALSLRAQHTSNGGLNEANPGLDMVGLTLAFHPRKAKRRRVF